MRTLDDENIIIGGEYDRDKLSKPQWITWPIWYGTSIENTSQSKEAWSAFVVFSYTPQYLKGRRQSMKIFCNWRFFVLLDQFLYPLDKSMYFLPTLRKSDFHSLSDFLIMVNAFLKKMSQFFSIISILKPKIRDEVATGKTISNIKILISTFGSWNPKALYIFSTFEVEKIIMKNSVRPVRTYDRWTNGWNASSDPTLIGVQDALVCLTKNRWLRFYFVVTYFWNTIASTNISGSSRPRTYMIPLFALALQTFTVYIHNRTIKQQNNCKMIIF